MKTNLKIGVALLGMMVAAPALSAELNMVCSNEQDWCDLMVANFEAKTGIDVAMVRKSTGETLAQVRAEASNPKIDDRAYNLRKSQMQIQNTKKPCTIHTKNKQA